MPGLKVALAVAQMDCVNGDVAANVAKIADVAAAARRLGAELVVFPECATTGYFLGDRLSDLAEPPDGRTAAQLGSIARANAVHLAVGAYTRDDGAIRNSQLLFGPDGGRLAVYHKAHLFASERVQCRPGDRPVVVDTELGRLGLTICYDLIFPDYARRLVELGAEIIVNSTNWIADAYQREVWGWTGPTAQSLASVRALENGVVLAMADRVGREALDESLVFDSLGHSTIAGPSGRILASVPAGEGVAVARVDYAEADLARWRGVATYRADRRPELYGAK
jgi:predicted amidohydrolase